MENFGRCADRSAIPVTLLRSFHRHWLDRCLVIDPEIRVIVGNRADFLAPDPGWLDLTEPCAGLGYHVENVQRIRSAGCEIRAMKINVPPLSWHYQPGHWGCELSSQLSTTEQLRLTQQLLEELIGSCDQVEIFTTSQFTAEQLMIPWRH